MSYIAVIVGSLRKDSINLKLAKALAKLAEDPQVQLPYQLIDISGLPLYNEDLWENPPPAVLQFKNEITAANGVLLVSPEYNRGITGPLKNAIDWASRPTGGNIWPHKPVGIVGASPGKAGAMAAQTQLRAIMVGLDTYVMGQPEVFLQFDAEAFGEQSDITNEKTRQFLFKYVQAFDHWVNQCASHSA